MGTRLNVSLATRQKITAIIKHPMEIEIHDDELGASLLRKASEQCGRPDDFASYWLTDTQGNTYIGDRDRPISNDPSVALLVDAGNYLVHGYAYSVCDSLHWHREQCSDCGAIFSIANKDPEKRTCFCPACGCPNSITK